MRNISQTSINKLNTTHGIEPVIIIEVAWSIGGKPVRYATKDLTVTESNGTLRNIPGKIIEIGTIDSVVGISMNDYSDEVPVTLDDIDGEIKSIINVNDIMLRDVYIYQWFEGIPFDDRFLIFQGKINSPVSWSETDRTVKFNVVSQLEDNEVGFSPEEGEFPDLPDELIGKVWPECFGTSVHQRAVQIDKKHSGSLGEGCGIADFTLPYRIEAFQQLRSHASALFFFFALAAGAASFRGLDQVAEQYSQKTAQMSQYIATFTEEIEKSQELYNEQLESECESFRVIGGEGFPRGRLTLDINGAKFTGSFSGEQGADDGNIFHVSEAKHPEYDNFFPTTTAPKILPYAIFTGSVGGDQAGVFFAQAGAGVTIASNEPLRYVATITPGAEEGVNNTGVLKVAAFATFDSGERVLVDVPENLYTVYKQQYGSVTATIVEVKDALSKHEPPWEDTIYVTFKSTIGPNPIDIIQYLIQKYTDFPIDNVSFNQCRTRLAIYPMHFCLADKKNILTVLRELAFMSRTAITLKSGKFFCKYLPDADTSTHTFNLDNVTSQSVEMTFTPTEDLVTKFIGSWRAHGAQDEDNEVILRYNIKKYGTHEDTFDFYAYNFVDIIVKVMTFWIIRRGNTWKKLGFRAALDALNVEPFDNVTLDFNKDWVSNGAVLATVEEADYNFNDNSMELVVWTGVRAGEMEQYDFSYPAEVSETLKFPTPTEESKGFDGSNGPGADAEGELQPRGRKQPTTRVVMANQGNDPYGINSNAESRTVSDKGTSKPSDVNDTDPGPPVVSGVPGLLITNAPPETDSIPETDPFPDSDPIQVIDIRTTPVIDSLHEGESTTLDTFFREVTDQVLKGNTLAVWKDEENNTSIFHFKYDTDSLWFGAGTAFLKDDV